jgi:uncharacterized membrane protein
MKPLFHRHAGEIMLEDPRLGAAAFFYLFYIGGILWFASWPAMAPDGGGWTQAALNGGLLGLMAYGCYESVNYATLRGWSLQMLASDILWGVVLTAACAAAGVLLTEAIGLTRT